MKLHRVLLRLRRVERWVVRPGSRIWPDMGRESPGCPLMWVARDVLGREHCAAMGADRSGPDAGLALGLETEQWDMVMAAADGDELHESFGESPVRRVRRHLYRCAMRTDP